MSLLFENFACYAVRGFAFFIRLLPHEAALEAGAAIGRVVAVLHDRRRVAYANVKAAFGRRYSPKEIRRLIRQNYANFAMTVIEVLRLPSMRPEYYGKTVELVHVERMDEALKKGKGLMILTAHFGNWELAVLTGPFNRYPQVNVLARRQNYLKLNHYLDELREFHGPRVIHKGISVKEIFRALRRNEIVGILGDQGGGRYGIPVRFFGRITTAPPGAIAMAMRLKSSIIPIFPVRLRGPRHRIYFEPPFDLVESGDVKKDLEENLQRYYTLLEQMIERTPDQWLWAHKRWKWSFTKRILILSDGKAGHLSQSRGLRLLLTEIQKESAEPFEFTFDEVEIHFKSRFHRFLIALLTPLILSWAQGRMWLLRPFISGETYSRIKDGFWDLVISSGSSLLPVHLFLSRENLSKRIVLMRPPFPFNLFRYDLVVMPRHDEPSAIKNKLSLLLSLNPISEEKLKEAGEGLRARMDPGKKSLCLLIGGGAKGGYRLPKEELLEAVQGIAELASEEDWNLLVTTSRRTPREIEEGIKAILKDHRSLRLLVIANEHNPPGTLEGMISSGDWFVVTEDSISMISEVLTSGKRLFVLSFPGSRLPGKHLRFHQELGRNRLAVFTSSGAIAGLLKEEAERESSRSREADGGRDKLKSFLEEERTRIKKKIKEVIY